MIPVPLLLLSLVGLAQASGMLQALGGATLLQRGGPVPILGDVSNVEIGSSANIGLWWLGGILVVLQIVAFFRPAPALHKQFADREDHDNDIKEIKNSLKDVNDKFEHWNTSQYDARRRMHKKINHMTSALAYFAGSIEKTQPDTARRMQSMLDKIDQEGGEE